MQTTTEIPAAAWSLYLDEIGERIQGHSVRIEVLGQDIGDQRITRHLTLLGMELIEKGSEKGGIELDLKLADDKSSFDHVVLHPTHLYAQATRSGEVERLDIEDTENHKTLITFDHPVAVRVEDVSATAAELKPIH